MNKSSNIFVGLRGVSTERLDKDDVEFVRKDQLDIYLNNPKDAPKDGTMLRLFVKYDHSEGSNPLTDSVYGWTIGFNQLHDIEEDVWEMAGWDWEQDRFTRGHGKVVGWLPFCNNYPEGNYEIFE